MPSQRDARPSEIGRIHRELAAAFAALLFLPSTASPASLDPGDVSKFVLVLPAAASLHGLPPAFFHSDVAVFNTSIRRVAEITATYRCSGSSCGNALQTFNVAPRQIVMLEDVVGNFFGAPETSGAIEFSSTERIVVTSRLYTPARPSPTFGMLVPGLTPEEALADAELVNLSHSADPSVGYRTNLAIYNPTDQTLSAFIGCRDFRYAALGFITQDVGPHQLLQINDGDLFREFGVLRNVPSFNCSIRGGFLTPFYSWASIIDNVSNDLTFVRAQQFFAVPRPHTIPAAASLHGVGGTFFRSDVAVFNDDVLAGANVTATYRCLQGGCPVSERSLILGPGETRVLADAVGSFFGAPESSGSIEFVTSGHISVTSRLYASASGGGTVGTTVPSVDSRAATPSRVLVLMPRGSRVNVGVVNFEDVAQRVRIRLFSAAGEFLGDITRVVDRRQSAQVNDVFGELGITADLAAAYCLVEGEGSFRVLAYAAIIDNESQDSIFVTGEDDPDTPRINLRPTP